MARQSIVITQATITLGPTGTEIDFSCQVISAAITPAPNAVDVPATFCAPASQTAAGSSYTLDVTFLQDWGATVAVDGADSISQYLFDHDSEQAAFHVEGIAVTGASIVADGTCTIVAGAYGGEAGVPLQATAPMPILGKPTIVTGVMAASSEPAEQLYQPA